MLTIDEILEKAFDSGDLATGGLLNPTQAASFVQGIFDNSVVLSETRRIPMRATKHQVDKITYGSDILQIPPAVGTAPSVVSEPTTTKVILDAQEIILAIDVGFDVLEDSIEGQGLFNTIMELTNRKVAAELETLVLFGDSGGATSTFLDIFDGVHKQVVSNVVDLVGVQLNKDSLSSILKKLPSKYFDVETDYRYYVSHLQRLDYIDSLADIGVDQAFVRYLVGDTEPAYQGTPVRKVPVTPTFDTGSGVLGSDGLLINPKNILWGIHRDITFEFDRQPRKRIIEITMTMRADVKLEEEEAIVKFVNVKHSV